jgi:hypothetical protein
MTKRRKITLLCASIFITLFATCQISSAESGYCTSVKVLSAGSKVDGQLVLLQNTRSDCGTWPKDSKRWLYLDDTENNANAMLAAAMTAMALDGTVVIIPKSDESYSNNSTLIHVTASP